MKLASLDKLLEDQLKDLFSAENQLLKALPKMAKAASSEPLREAFQMHLEETRGQVERLEKIGKTLGIKLTGKKCAAMEGLIEEGKEVLEAEGPEYIIDAALIIAAQRVEHYEISGYGSARTLAEHLGHEEVAGLLQETLDEESAADEKLTTLCVEEVLPAGEAEEEMEESEGEEEEGGEEEVEEEEEPAPARGRRKS
ncbi:MAG: ferritin-like domain-containing protein [Gemmataceae bacterium]|nr:ferritin-like domain-containing protein [Gemmataceae bacterium]